MENTSELLFWEESLSEQIVVLKELKQSNSVFLDLSLDLEEQSVKLTLS
jgi:hypothetical protein